MFTFSLKRVIIIAMILRFAKTRSVKSPTRAHLTDAGIDFYIPNDYPSVILHPHESCLIPSGIKVEIPQNFVGVFLNKSSIAKNGLIIGAQVIDPYYSGEVHLDLHNVGTLTINLIQGMKIAQMLIIPCFHFIPTEVDQQDLYEHVEMNSKRGEKGFGSSERV